MAAEFIRLAVDRVDMSTPTTIGVPLLSRHGDYHPWDFPPGGLGITVFDKLEVVDVIREQFFGSNGAQVITALEWFRSLFVEREDKDELQIVPQFRSSYESMWRYCQDRLSHATFDVALLLPDPEWEGLRNRSGARVRARPWLKPWRLRDAWNTALVAAAETERLEQCRWLSRGSPALAALALRDSLPVTSFRIMYEPMEELIPLRALDAKAPPVVRA